MQQGEIRALSDYDAALGLSDVSDGGAA